MDRPRNAHPADPAGGTPEPSDADLMLAVAERRDVAAFEQLFQRYERLAYNLALHLTTSSALAEEAVQEAMMRLWRSASNFRPDGRFKGWFLAIVADRSIDLLRRKSREKARVERHAKDQPRDIAKDPGADMERHELNRALHRQMEQLDPLDRRLLALYYGADMSQQEIGRVLDVPQTTVSMKLRDALSKLRSGLTAAGFAGAVPLLEAGKLGDALLGGAQAPALLHGKVLKGLSAAARHSARAGAAASKGGAGIWAAVTLCVAAAAGGGYYWANAQPPAESAPLRPAPAQASAQAPAAPSGFYKHWDFNSVDDLKDFTVSIGSWRWVEGKGRDGSACMETDSDRFVASFKLPPEAVQPLVFEYEVLAKFNDGPKGSNLLIGPTHVEGNACMFHNIGDPAPVGIQWRNFSNYLMDGWLDQWVEGKHINLISFERLHLDELSLTARGQYCINSITVRSARPGEVPDTSIYRETLARIPVEKRKGQVPVTGLAPAYPDKPVYVEFFNTGPYHRVWDFTQEKLPDSDFKKGGVWSHEPCSDGGMCLASTKEKNGLSFRLDKLALPVRLRVVARPLSGVGGTEAFVYPRHLQLQHGAFFHNLAGPPPKVGKDEWFHYEFILHGDLVDHRVGGTRILATWLDPVPGSPLWLVFDGPQQLRRIEVEEVNLEEAPDVAPLRKALEAIPAAKRKGRVDLPPGPGLPAGAYLEFDPKRLMEQIQIGG